MAISDLVRSYQTPVPRLRVGPSFTFLAAIAATAAVAGIAARTLNADYVLPLASTSLFTLAALVAMLGWRESKLRQQALTYWDVAGALTLIGIGAATLVEPEQMMRITVGTAR